MDFLGLGVNWRGEKTYPLFENLPVPPNLAAVLTRTLSTKMKEVV